MSISLAPLQVSPAHESHQQSQKRRVFHSIFPPPISASIPTPIATPISSFPDSSPSAVRSSPAFPSQPFASQQNVNDVIAHNRAWHLATSFLSFPNEEFVIDEEEPFSPSAARGGRGKYVMRMQLRLTREVKDAMVYLVKSAELGIGVGEGNKESLVEWYVCEVRRHFLGYVKPALEKIEVGDSLVLLSHITKRHNIHASPG